MFIWGYICRDKDFPARGEGVQFVNKLHPSNFAHSNLWLLRTILFTLNLTCIGVSQLSIFDLHPLIRIVGKALL